MHEELTELSAYAYDNRGWHQVSIDNVQDRLQNISNALKMMDDKWTRNDEATRNLDTIRKKDQQPATSIDVCTITSLDAKILAMDDRLQTYEDMHDRFANSSSIDRLRGPWIDGKNPVELLPYTAAEVDKITSRIYTAIGTMEERLEKRCDDIYFPFDNRIGGLGSHVEWLHKEVKAIQRQLAAQHQISASIDRKRAKSLDSKSPRSTDKHLIASIDAGSTPAGEQLIHKRIESMHEELTEPSAYAYENIGWHQVSIDNVQDRLQNISNVLKKMDDKWTRNDEATRKPQCSAEHKDEWEVSYINTRINDVYYPLNNNVDWLSTKIELLQQDMDTIRKKDQQPATSIDVCTITSLDAKISAMDDRLQTYEDMHDRFANSSSIDRLRGPWIDGKNPVELLTYTAAEVDKITSKIYTAIGTIEERLDKRCVDIYFPFDNRISGLDSHAEWLQKEVKAIQRQLAAQHQISASIDRKRAKSLNDSTIDAKADQPINYTLALTVWKVTLLQQDLDTIRKKDQQPATSIDVCTITSLDAKISAMDDRLQTYEDMHDRFANSFSIDRLRGPWIDGNNHVELLPYTAAEVDKITSKIYTAIDTMEERLDKRCDDIYFPFFNRIGGLDSHAEWLQKEVKAIQRQLAAQHHISASIDRKPEKLLDGKSPRSTDEHLIASIDAESTPAGEQLIQKTIESMHEELTELSAYTYENIHQVSIDNVQDWLQNVSNILKKMGDKWTRNNEATRSFIVSWSRI
ncbi:hypothetical protein F2Q68_00044832 [Brassica cretica]|uniref:Uncharacterized protein n=1 Tax=Brassica cretica TaxID=69181 RepID=A0A8S9LJZ1_BRACR|nr:hypothetical protein F2Q68_00044832 [Brassica cretica]